ncbi:MAG TPA: hypothetical protein VN229_04700 [Terriglobales bacterium]|nr:hypothetical protein [Terriglobales bacterium]
MIGEKANQLPLLHTGVVSPLAAGRRQEGDRPLRPGEWLMLALLALATFGCIAYATVKPRSLSGETLVVAVIGGPRDAAMAAVAAAGGLALRDGVLPGSVVARATDAGFIERLRHAGANLIYRVDSSVNCAGAK